MSDSPNYKELLIRLSQEEEEPKKPKEPSSTNDGNRSLHHKLNAIDKQWLNLQRKIFPPILWLVVCWWVFVAIMIFLCSAGTVKLFWVELFSFNFNLSDSVLIALLGSGSINITVLLLTVVRHLFPNHKNTYKKKRSPIDP